MEVLKLSVEYYGYYGGDINETVLLPSDVNGVLFEHLDEGTHKNTVYLGEIEGKHSECYGDLVVEVIDLDNLTIKEASELINKSDVGRFEMFLEEKEYDFAEDEEEYSEKKVSELLDFYNIEPTSWMVRSTEIHDKFIKRLKEMYVKKFKTLTVLEDDLNEAVKVLRGNGIQVHE